MTNTKNTKRAIALIAAAAAVTLAGCSVASTEPDQAGLHYSAGPLSSTEFSNCIQSGTRNIDGPSDKHFYYPAGQRNYVFRVTGTDGEDRDTAAFTAPTKDAVQLTVEGQILFELNTDCDTLREFHERIGLKNEDWDALLRVYLAQPLNRAITEATAGFAWQELYSDPAKKAEWEAAVKARLPEYVKQATGGEYFRNFSVTLQKPIIPDELQKALEQAQVAAKQTEAQAQRNVQVQSELESIKALVAVLGPDGYNTYQAIKDGRIQVVTIPQGSSVVVQPR